MPCALPGSRRAACDPRRALARRSGVGGRRTLAGAAARPADRPRRRAGGGACRPRRPSAERRRAAGRHGAGPRPAHLHLGYHGLAEGGVGQPPPGDELERLVRRHDGRLRPSRPALQLPADVPQRRRGGGDRRPAGRPAARWSIAGKFSAGRFWDDVVRWDCTLFQYIGELCRYLTHAPPRPRERAPSLRICCGNGLQPDVWTRFPGALRHSAGSSSSTPRPKATSRCSTSKAARRHRPHPAVHGAPLPVALVAFDPETVRPRATRDGRASAARRAKPAKRSDVSRRRGDPAHRFEGYTNAAETEKKVLRDVFEPGDAWLRTGDLMRRDGGASSASSTGSATPSGGRARTSAPPRLPSRSSLSGCRRGGRLRRRVPRTDGRAGMAAIVTGRIQSGAIACIAGRGLPAYARPLFLRIIPALPTTETFKVAHARLAAEGFDPNQIADPLSSPIRPPRHYHRWTPPCSGAWRRANGASSSSIGRAICAPIASTTGPPRHRPGPGRRNSGSCPASRRTGRRRLPVAGVGIGLAFIAEWIALGHMDERRRLAPRSRARSGETRGSPGSTASPQ